MSGDLLQTKLYVPQLRPSIVPRPHLIKRLNKGIQPGHKLTLISAPAGFGKTTLVSEWVHNLRFTINDLRLDSISQIANRQSKIVNQIAWLSIDAGDNDPVQFLAYLVAALQKVETGFGERLLAALKSPQPPPTESLLTSLLNEISTISDKFILVLDDYHLIDAQTVDNALTFLLEHMPLQMHLVIATREDPKLPLPRLRARGQLTELRAVDLRFSSSEAAEFLNQTMGLALSAEDIAALETRTEGWIAGLQLAAVSMQGHKDASALIKSFTGSHRFVLDYLIEEVLEQQSDSVQSFLLQTAVLDQLSGSLCDALTGQDNGQATLELLDRANLFIVPLDEERHWYRYHHLFADLLRQRLRQTLLAQIPSLHRRASLWYEQKGQAPEAIRHAFAAEDFERTADLAELVWPAWSGNLQSITWRGWVKKLPEDIVQIRPVLSVAYAQTLLNAGKLEAAETWLLAAERWQESSPKIRAPETSSIKTHPERSQEMVVVDEAQYRALPAWLATTRAYHAQAIGDVHSTVKYVEQALELFPKDDQYNRAAVTGLLGLAYWASGDLEAAYRTFSDGLFQNIHDRIKGTFVLADMQMALGHLREAESVCEHGLKLAKAYDEPNPIGTEDIYSEISEIHREQGKLETAVQDLQICKKLGEQVELPDWQHRYYIAQARLNMSLGNLDIAIDLLDEASQVFVRTPVPEMQPIAAMKARVWVKQGRLTKALAWANERSLSVDDDLSYMREFDYVTFVRMFIAQYREMRLDATIQKAIRLLERLLKAAEREKRVGSVIEILVLHALAFEAHNNISSALISLERALMLAEPEGYIRLFVDEGAPMARLLQAALSQGITQDYVRRLLAAFPPAKPKPITPPKTHSTRRIPHSEILDPLSEREIEVLQQIAEGFKNREIAERLYLSLNTVKVHTRHIYSKLDVHTRTQAVARARALDILPTNQSSD